MTGKIQGLIKSLELKEKLSVKLSDGYFSKNKQKSIYYEGRATAFRDAKKFIEENFK
jgi:hypothetical protein